MGSFVRNLFLLFVAGGFLFSCTPFKGEKSELRFRDNTLPIIIKQEPVAANFKSVYQNFIKRSCLDCHNSKTKQVSFETKQDIIDNADDIVFYAEDGCALGSCMPELDDNGKPKRPIPSAEVLQAFKDWADNNFEDVL